MDNIDILYDNESSSDSDSECSNYSMKSEKGPKINTKIKNNNIIINTIDRDWINLYKDTFSFNIKFNNNLTTNNNDITIKNTFNDLKSKQNINNFIESPSLSLPIDIKNIYNIEITSLLIPPRYIYINNNNFYNILNLDGVSLVVEEYDKICYGTNSVLNKSFCNLIPDSCEYTDDCNNLMLFKNINNTGIYFYPALLNTINTLTIKIYDMSGNELKYLNNSLNIKSIKNLGNNSNFLKIETENYFSRLNYRENDIILIKNVNIGNNNIKLFLENEEHQIYFDSDFIKKKNLNIEPLINVLYIKKKGNYNLLTGIYNIINELKNTTNNDIELIQSNDKNGMILNKNLQLKVFMNIKTKEREVLFESNLI